MFFSGRFQKVSGLVSRTEHPTKDNTMKGCLQAGVWVHCDITDSLRTAWSSSLHHPLEHSSHSTPCLLTCWFSGTGNLQDTAISRLSLAKHLHWTGKNESCGYLLLWCPWRHNDGFIFHSDVLFQTVVILNKTTKTVSEAVARATWQRTLPSATIIYSLSKAAVYRKGREREDLPLWVLERS
jgi:hypothetical protein